MDIRKALAITALVLIFLPFNTPAVEETVDEHDLFRLVTVKDGSELSIIDCVGAAFNNSPKIRRQKYNLDIAKSQVGIAKSQYFPVISAGAAFYNENNSDNIYYNSHYRELPTVAVTVNKLVWDFGKTTAYIKMEEFYKIGAEYEFIDSLCSTLFDVKARYYNLLRMAALLQISETNGNINRKYVKWAKNKAEEMTAKLNLSEASAEYLRDLNNYETAKTDLSNSMYLDDLPDYSIQNTKTFPKFKDFNKIEQFTPQNYPFSPSNAVEIAYKNSPDLQVLISTRGAMEQSLAFIKKTYYPELSASAGYGYLDSNFANNNYFQVGVNLTSSINFMELKHSIKGADAQLNHADNEIALFKKDLYFEVKRALNNVDKLKKQIPIAENEISEAYENLETVEKGYRSGELDYTALQDCRKDYINALTRYVNTLYEYNLALIQVEMAMHCHIADIHHKSEHAIEYHSEELLEHLNEVLNCNEKETKKRSKHSRL